MEVIVTSSFRKKKRLLYDVIEKLNRSDRISQFFADINEEFKQSSNIKYGLKTLNCCLLLSNKKSIMKMSIRKTSNFSI